MNILVSLLIYLLVAGLIALLIKKAPFIDEQFKQIAIYVVLVVFVILVIGLLIGFGPGPIIVVR